MKLPRNLNGDTLARALQKFDYQITRQTGSHLRLTTHRNGERLSLWADHFSWSSDRLKIIGTTAIGRATANILDLNRPRLLKIRAADLQVNRHPPFDDPVLPS